MGSRPAIVKRSNSHRGARPRRVDEGHVAASLSDRAFQAYLVEYEECTESYRHAVSTIWKASAVVAVISAGVLAFAFSADSRMDPGASSFAQGLALLPMIVWCFGIYRPLNRYAELKCDRACRIEELLSERVVGLEMRHFRDYRDHRRGQSVTGTLSGLTRRQVWSREWNRLWTLRIVTEPRIVEVVTACGLGLVVLEGLVVAHGLGAL
jgi:hypothetical protein